MLHQKLSTNKIDKYDLGPKVLAWAATRSTRQIAQSLSELGYDVGYSAVHRYLQEHLDECREVTAQVRAAVQTSLQQEILSDVQMLEKLRNELAKAVFDNSPETIGAFWFKAAKELRETLEMRFKIAGADGDGSGDHRVAILPATEVDRRLRELGIDPAIGPAARTTH